MAKRCATIVTLLPTCLHPTSLKLLPVENWKDSHEAVTVQWKGVGEKNAKVSLK